MATRLQAHRTLFRQRRGGTLNITDTSRVWAPAHAWEVTLLYGLFQFPHDEALRSSRASLYLSVQVLAEESQMSQKELTWPQKRSESFIQTTGLTRFGKAIQNTETFHDLMKKNKTFFSLTFISPFLMRPRRLPLTAPASTPYSYLYSWFPWCFDQAAASKNNAAGLHRYLYKLSPAKKKNDMVGFNGDWYKVTLKQKPASVLIERTIRIDRYLSFYLAALSS